MIYAIYSNNDKFHDVLFLKGENIICADRTAASTVKDTRNAVGKSLLIEIIDFCLGNQLKGKKGLKSREIRTWSFTMEIDLNRKRTIVTRSLHDDKKIILEYPGNSKKKIISIEKWRFYLGECLFALSPNLEEFKYRPSLRSLLKYFIRTGKESYIDAFRPVLRRKGPLIQIDNAYLLGLDWKNSSSLQVLKDKDTSLSSLRKAVKEGVIDAYATSAAKLETEYTLLSRECRQIKSNLDRFEVLPEYREIEKKANDITGKINRLRRENFRDNETLANYVESTKEPEYVDLRKLEYLFNEAGTILPESILKTLEEAQEFHTGLIKDRKAFLLETLTSLRNEIFNREKVLEKAIKERAGFLSALKNKRALDDFIEIQNVYTEKFSRCSLLEEKIAQKKELETAKEKIKIEGSILGEKIRQDREEKTDILNQAIYLFADCSKALYEHSGDLIIDTGKNGYQFSTEIEGSSSEGKGKMQIFCYDLTLMILARLRGFGIDFLIHDSTIFDGVDSRQCARALELADRLSEKYNFQYICTINSDMLPKDDFSIDFDYKSRVRMTLSDKDDAGSLFGMRF